MSKPSTVSEALNAAADLLVDKGWCQGFRKNDLGQRCMAGSLCEVTTGNPYDGSARLFIDASNALADSLGGAIGLKEVAVTWWNDENGRTAEDAIEALRQAAEEHE